MANKSVTKKRDEADVLFGDDNKHYPAGNIGFPDAEANLICRLAGPELTLQKKVRIRDEYRAADKDGKWALIQKYCGPMKVGRDEVLGV
jgi:hypothetical protein